MIRGAMSNAAFTICHRQQERSYDLHPMLLIDRLYAIGKVRKALWRHWYSFVTLRVGGDVLFLCDGGRDFVSHFDSRNHF